MKKILSLIFVLVSVNLYSQIDTAKFNSAKNLYFNQEYVDAINEFERYMPFEKDSNLIADIYHYIGISYYMLGDHDMAIKNISNNLEIHKRNNNVDGIGNAYNNLGAIYDVQKKYEQALIFYIRSFELAKSLDDTVSIAGSLNNIGSAKLNLNRNKEALIDLKQALNINIKHDQPYAIILNYRNIGNAYKNLKILDSSLYYHNMTLELSIKLDHKQTISASYENIGEVYIETKDFNNAIRYLNKSLDISKELDLIYYKQVACLNLSLAYDGINNADSSLYYYKLYTDAKDTVFSKENREYTSYLEIKYKTKEKENKILKMQHEDEIQNANIEKQKSRNNLLMIIILISVLGAIVIILLYRTTKRALKENVVISTKLKTKNDDITDSIKYAKNIQQGLLSTAEKFKANIPNSFVMFKPKDIVSGDFYWTLNQDNKQYFAAVDCTGHGVPGAMMSIIGHTGLTRAIREYGLTKPNEILNKLNLMVSSTFDKEQEIKDGMDLSLCMINNDTKILSCSMANNPVYIIRNKNETKLDYKGIEIENKILYKIEANKQYIGCGELYDFTNHEIQLEEGDRVYIFSDGFPDQFGGEKGKKYMYKNFQKFLTKICDFSEEDQLTALKNEFKTWTLDEEQIDDVLVIGVKL